MDIEKTCFKCGEAKAISFFYKHSAMADGFLNKCKSCSKKDVKENRKSKIDYYREYDKARGNRQDKGYMNNYRKKFPNKAKAHSLVRRAIISGNLFRMPCEICNSKDNIHAHHDDYLKPLNVRWLCPAHHSEWHKKNGDGLNP